MAINTAEKRRNVAGNMPTPDGVISIYDRRQIAGNYRGLPIPVAVSGTLTPAGNLARKLSAFRSFGGTLTPTGVVAYKLHLYRTLGGTLTPAGTVAAVLRMIKALNGNMAPSGALTLGNPAWLLLDETLIWQGEWNTTTVYGLDDVVLYKKGNEWHVFVSKITHNAGYIPTSTASAWRRLYQEKWS